MRIACPFCGERGVEEFAYHGDATVTRPEADAPAEAWIDYVYFRDNPAGCHRELWYHAAGCHSWLVIERDLGSHAVFNATVAGEAASARTKEGV